MKRRTEMLQQNADTELKELEREGLAYNAKFKNWECSGELLKNTKNGSALYMHCLPADITGVSCENGEVQKEVFEKYRIPTYIEASYKPYIIASMIMNSKFVKPGLILESLLNKSKNLRFTNF
jgi:ornithine carbamoyltransferase